MYVFTHRYNKAHRKTRSIVERTFGMWKWFPYLSKGLSIKFEASATIIVACAVIDNIAVNIDDEVPLEINKDEMKI